MTTSGTSVAFSAEPTTELEALAEELGAVARQIETQVNLKVAAELAVLRAKDAERELALTKFVHDILSRVEEKLASVRDGKDGIDGVAGKDGADGERGPIGPAGERGERGEPGEKGEQGAQGQEGAPGLPGERGADGHNGNDGAQGPQGEIGLQGERGLQGLQGERGLTGEQGLPGLIGPQGFTGEQGPQGADGLKGDIGPQGERGLMGEAGSPGEKGATGERGEAGPMGCLPVAKLWTEQRYAQGSVVKFDGELWQAVADTDKKWNPDDWELFLPKGQDGKDGKSFKIRGTFASEKDYEKLDIVACNGGSFVALKDDPGTCPGPGWQLVAGPGKRGDKGLPGERGLQGAAGSMGVELQGWLVNAKEYSATPIMSDGSKGPDIQLRNLFEQFLIETKET